MSKRNVDVLVGLQFGSEGKGKIAALLADQYGASVRVGAPNAGHTVIFEHKPYKMRSIPCAWVNPKCHLFIGAGGLINLNVLRHEIAMLRGIEQNKMKVADRLAIDVNAGIVAPSDIEEEEATKMFEGIGSTCEGIGVAAARKLLRRKDENGYPLTAKDIEELQPFLANVGHSLNVFNDQDVPILIEGTQGFGLSLNHGYYPYCTSRDVLASSMLGECGLAPSTVRKVIGVMRTYPIRVFGNSGPMGAEELTWDQVAKESGYESLIEKTTVTGRVRRVSRINWDLLQAAVEANKPDELAVMFGDYISAEDRGVSEWIALSTKTRNFVHEVEHRLQVPVKYLSTGPKPEETVVLDGGGMRVMPDAVMQEEKV